MKQDIPVDYKINDIMKPRAETLMTMSQICFYHHQRLVQRNIKYINSLIDMMNHLNSKKTLDSLFLIFNRLQRLSRSSIEHQENINNSLI